MTVQPIRRWRDTAEAPRQQIDPGISRAGADGEDGLSPDVCGLFDATVDYRRLSIVAVNGSSFIAKKDGPGPCPGAGWQLLVSQGKAGPKGERGLQGIPGASVSIIDWKIDEENYSATPIMSDRSEGQPLPLRKIFERFHLEAR